MVEQSMQHTGLSIPVDTELGGWRISIAFIFIALSGSGYIGFNMLIPSDGLNVIALIASFVVAALLSQQIEKFLKQRTKGARLLNITTNGIELSSKGKLQVTIDGTQHANVLMWRFIITRRARVPKGWHMLACALEQDNSYLTIYTFISPQEYEKLDHRSQFTLLKNKQERADSRAGREDLRLAGEQRRLHMAENFRWLEGAEVGSDEFTAYLETLQKQFPQWMP